MILAHAPLRADELRAALQDAFLGRTIEVCETTSSTNDDIFTRALAGAAEGLTIFAEEQTAARGQHGRRWQSPACLGLWFSILFPSQEETTLLPSWAAKTLADVLGRSFGLAASFKMPNDVLVGGKKIAGILAERRARPDAPHITILGLGLNVNQAETDFPPELRASATSLALAVGHPVDRTRVAVEVLQRLNASYRP